MRGLTAEERAVLEIASMPIGQRGAHNSRPATLAEYAAGQTLIARGRCQVVTDAEAFSYTLVATPSGREALRIARLLEVHV